MEQDELAEKTAILEHSLSEAAGVRWARVHPALNRLIVSYDPDRTNPELLSRRLETVETLDELGEHAFGSERPEQHPGDREPLLRTAVELGADVFGFAMATILRTRGRQPSRREIDIAAILSLVDGVPALRQPIERFLGVATTELLIDLTGTLNRIFVQSQTGSASRALDRALRLRELHARRRLWASWEPDLCANPERIPRPNGASRRRRPEPAPAGPVDDYAGKATAAALGAFGLGIASSHQPEGAAAALFAGLPQPAQLGRQAFASHLGARLAASGVLVMEPDILRTLDRIDTVIVSEEVAAGVPGLSGAARQADVEMIVANGKIKKRIRKRQRRGRGVCVIGLGAASSYELADCAVGVRADDGEAPWGAHIFCSSRHNVPGVVRAIGLARRCSRQSVALSAMDTAIGLGLSSSGLAQKTTERIMSAASAISILAMANGVRLAHQVTIDDGSQHVESPPWHELEVNEVLARLGSDRRGLADAEARSRRTPSRRPRPAAVRIAGAVYEELANPMTPVLLAGAGLSVAVGARSDAGLITGVVMANALFGGIERFQAETAVQRLAGGDRPPVRVRRRGRVVPVDAGQLVPGDVVEIETGEVVPADGRLIECRGLEIDEAALTGESLPVLKTVEPTTTDTLAERRSMVYQGSSVAAGTGTFVITAAGERTEAQRAAAMGEESAEHDTGVEKRLESLTRVTLPFAGVSGAILAAAAALRGRGAPEILGSGISLAVAAVPEGLPVLATISQLAAARRLSRHRTLVRNPRAVEALGRVDVLCADKTATLTEGSIRLTMVSDGHDEQELSELDANHRRVLEAAVRATPEADGDGPLPHSTDRALLEGAESAEVGAAGAFRNLSRERELPFASSRGFHAAQSRHDEGRVISVKGAPELILSRCSARRRDGTHQPLSEAERGELRERADQLAAEGYRVLAVAERMTERDAELSDDRIDELIFDGYVCFTDRARPTARAAVDDLRRAGVRTIMLTGDHPSTALKVARELGIEGGEVVVGPELESMDDEELARRARAASVFARVTPSHKLRIVRSLKSSGATVAMTGDGANDAPAIQLADVGIAVGSRATAAARQAADVIVTDERIETIVTSVLEGRALWTSVRDAISILVGGNLGEIVFTLVSGVLPLGSGLNPRQLLLVNIITDTLPALAIASAPPRSVSPEQLMAEGTERSLGEELDRDIVVRAVITAGAAGAGYASARLFGRRGASTVALVALTGSQLAQTMLAGGRGKLVVTTSLVSMAAVAGVVQTPGLSQFFGCRPLGPLGWAQACGATGAAALASFWAGRRSQHTGRDRPGPSATGPNGQRVA